MRRIITTTVLFALLISLVCPLNVAATNTTASNTTVFTSQSDGRLVITIEEYDLRTSQTKVGKKEHTFYDAEGNKCWTITLYGTFSYDGSSATCLASSANVTIYDNNWYKASEYVTKIWNIASANISMGKRILGVTVSEKEYQVTLVCSKTGVLS